MKILLTGGAGYIGSHTALVLLEAGYEVVALDNLVNSSAESVVRVDKLTGGSVQLVVGDLSDQGLVESALRDGVDAVIHFAGLKAVGESIAQPLRYFSNNVSGSLSLLRAMDATGVRTLAFSSSATVYGEVERLPITEDMPLCAANPYGRTKQQIEQILVDLAGSDDRWHIALLRYFNPAGAHRSGRIGEDPHGVPNNLMPFVAQVAVGRREKLVIYGTDYPTPDGTCIRDYVHVMDLARGHLAALEALPDWPGAHAWNLGTGRGASVWEVLRAFERAVGHDLAHQVGPRRPGDAPVSYADTSRAASDLSWSATHSLDDMCADHWRWQQDNPDGYPG